jgi:DNA polymerase
LPLDLTPEADLAALAWLVELGADEAIGDAPVDRFAASARPAVAAPKPAQAAASAPAAPPPDPAGPDGTAALAAACADLAALRAAMAGFDGSALRLGARNLVFADGNPAGRLMVIGEAPGREEDRAGLPFVGPSGQLLDRMLAAIGLSRRATEAESAAYITNVLPWRPPQNREPSGDEVALLLPFLFRHIELAAPEIILLLGTPATRAVLGTEQGIMRMRGRWHAWRGIPAMATYHPAALLRDGAKKRDVWGDLLLVRQRLEGGR